MPQLKLYFNLYFLKLILLMKSDWNVNTAEDLKGDAYEI